MIRKKRKSERKNTDIADLVILGIVSSIVVLALNSASWVKSAWEEVDFSTIMFQMHTPLNGTNQEILGSYYENCVPQTVRIVLVILFIYCLLKCLRTMTFSFSGVLFHIRINLSLGEHSKMWNFLSKGYFIGMLLGYGVFCCYAAKDIGVFEYLYNRMSKSMIFEEQYIAPNDVALAFPDKKRNLILIYLESMETTYASTEVGGGKKINYIPELTKLAQNNINFSNGLQLGGGSVNSGCNFTMGAIVGTSSGVPFKSMIQGNSMSNYARFLPGLTTLGEILEREGYENYFLCGSDAEFGGRKLFYEEHGNYHIHDYYYAINKGYIPENYHEFWGFEDNKLFEIAKTELNELSSSGKAFNYTMLTVDTHHPAGYICELCEDKYAFSYANAISCSDKLISEFVAWIQQQSWYQNTTIVLIGDHTSMAPDFWDDIDGYERKTYNCFLNVPEGINIENNKEREFNTLDYFPTILASLGIDIEGERLGLGTNLFSGEFTLLEQFGDEYEDELSSYSEYYVNVFEKANGR